MSDLINPTAAILLGGFSEIIELCADCGVRIEGILTPTGEKEIRGIPVLGDDESAAGLAAGLRNLPLVLGVGGAERRRRIESHYRGLGFRFAGLVHPSAKVAPSARLGEGVILNIGTNVSSDVVVEDLATLNVRVNVMHDSIVGSHSFLAPNAVVLGRVRIGPDSYIGANSTILPSLEIGDGATVGAGAVVTRSVAAGTTVVGNPARPLPGR